MSDPITRNFNASLQKTYEWLEDVGNMLPFGDRQTAYHALRGVFHVLRDRLTPEEACDLAAELPTVLRGVYFEGYSPANKPEKMNEREFLNQVKTRISPVAEGLDAATCVAAVFHVLSKRVSVGEITHIRGCMPREYENLWSA